MKKKCLMALTTLFIVASCTTYTPHMVTNNPTKSKKGEACAKFVLGFNTSGEEMISKAAHNGQITRIATVDRKTTGFFPFVWHKCTIVTGS